MPGINCPSSSDEDDDNSDCPARTSEWIHSKRKGEGVAAHRGTMVGQDLARRRRATDSDIPLGRPRPAFDSPSGEDPDSPRSPASIMMPTGALHCFEDGDGVRYASGGPGEAGPLPVQPRGTSWTQGTSSGSRSVKRRATEGDGTVEVGGAERSSASLPVLVAPGSRR